jgi:hypothetical protein
MRSKTLSRRRKLRKQPKMQRVKVSGAAALPRIVVPKTAKKRRRRNQRRYRLPTEAIKKVVTSARWLSLALLSVCIWAFVVVGQEERFYLTSIPVAGNRTISSSDIVYESGLAGIHVFGADPNDAAERINQIPGVISATVTLEWPNKVDIQIGEDSPIAFWEQNGKRYWINESGMLIQSRSDSADLLVIKSEVNEPIEEKSYVAQDVLIGALKLRELRPNINQLFFKPGIGLSYQDGRGWRAYFGIGPDMEQKLVVYETVVEDLLSRAVTPAYISVRNQTKPYYMVKATS